MIYLLLLYFALVPQFFCLSNTFYNSLECEFFSPSDMKLNRFISRGLFQLFIIVSWVIIIITVYSQRYRVDIE